MDAADFPANSKKSREAKEPKEPKPDKEEKVITKVVTGVVVERKKSFGTKMREVFIGGEFKSASTYIVAEVLLPALRNTIVEATTKGIERMIYGDNVPRGRSSFGGPFMNSDPRRGRVQYSTPVERYGSPIRRSVPSQSNPSRNHGMNDIVLESREEAELVVQTLGDIISQYDVATIKDLKAMLELDSNFIDGQWGWDSIAFVEIRQIRDGWLIRFPEPAPIN